MARAFTAAMEPAASSAGGSRRDPEADRRAVPASVATLRRNLPARRVPDGRSGGGDPAPASGGAATESRPSEPPFIVASDPPFAAPPVDPHAAGRAPQRGEMPSDLPPAVLAELATPAASKDPAPVRRRSRPNRSPEAEAIQTFEDSFFAAGSHRRSTAMTMPRSTAGAPVSAAPSRRSAAVAMSMPSARCRRRAPGATATRSATRPSARNSPRCPTPRRRRRSGAGASRSPRSALSALPSCWRRTRSSATACASTCRRTNCEAQRRHRPRRPHQPRRHRHSRRRACAVLDRIRRRHDQPANRCSADAGARCSPGARTCAERGSQRRSAGADRPGLGRRDAASARPA
jgi:hypothetical protein